MKLKLKHAIRGWISTLVGIALLTMTVYKTYLISFETITFAQFGIIAMFIILGIYLIFVPDSFLKDMKDVLTNKLNK